tara:strand:+ start:7523 stop:7834 length:312 start_codon:yes stop_codon:yes gene_type:complete
MPEIFTPFTPILLSKYLFFGLMSIFGGIVHALVEKKNGPSERWTDTIILSFISGFCGCMWTLMALIVYPENTLIVGFSAGMGGFLSVRGLTILITHIRNKFLK